MTSYGQFCPMAKALEVLDERWTLLIVRELLLGSTRFNDLRRGNPRMSPALLSKRLRTLEHAGVVDRDVLDGRARYTHTRAGRELAPDVDALQVWGVRWVSTLGTVDLDPHLLLWDMKRSIHTGPWPPGRTVLALSFTDVEGRAAHWWICVSNGVIDVCDYDPGFDVTARVELSLRTLAEIWRGDRSWSAAASGALVEIDAPRSIQRAVPRWIGQSEAALVPRPAPIPAR